MNSYDASVDKGCSPETILAVGIRTIVLRFLLLALLILAIPSTPGYRLELTNRLEIDRQRSLRLTLTAPRRTDL